MIQNHQNTVMLILQNQIITQTKIAQMMKDLNRGLGAVMGELSQIFGKRILTFMVLEDLPDLEKNPIDLG